MSYRQPTPRARRRTRSTMFAALVVVAALVGAAGCRSLVSTSSAASSTVAVASAHPPEERLRGDVPGGLPRLGVGKHPQEPGVADGEVPDGVTVFNDEYPAVAKLDPALLGALRSAAEDAAGDGVVFEVNSGWRSPAYQEQLLDEAIAKYGSRAEAARWVATPATSLHVLGDAVDLGRDARSWLSEHGAEYGLCQIYSNEPWHYELRTEAVDHGCPPMYADPTDDPRMQH